MNQRGVATATKVIVGVISVALIIFGVYQIISGLRGGGVSVTSFDIKADITSQGSTSSYRYRTKDLGSPNEKIRGDTLSGQWAGTSFIMRIGENKVYVYENGQWANQSASAEWQYYIQQYSSAIQNISNYLSKWTGGDVTFEYQNQTFRLYEIQVNPALSDNIFQPI